jgi:hypothetical protein
LPARLSRPAQALSHSKALVKHREPPPRTPTHGYPHQTKILACPTISKLIGIIICSFLILPRDEAGPVDHVGFHLACSNSGAYPLPIGRTEVSDWRRRCLVAVVSICQ